VLLAAATAWCVPHALAATYKWVDEKGTVHYSDKIPPEAVNRGNVELDKNGIPIRRTAPPLTPEERKALADEARRQQELAQERELIERRNRALLSTYTAEAEIDLARSRALSTIAAQIQSATAYSATLAKRKEELEARKAALGERPMPPVMENEFTTLDTELAKQAALIAAKEKESAVVNARYDTDKKRWKELRAIADAETDQVNRVAREKNAGGGSLPAPATPDPRK
jgi:hypothetical protein